MRVLTILVLSILFSLDAGQSFGCSMPLRPPLDVDPSEAAFIGTVKGVANRTLKTPEGEPAWGVRVSVGDAIFLPSDGEGVKEYVVYPFALGTDCSKVPMTKGEIEKVYPPGTEVWVIGVRISRAGAVELELEAWAGDGRYLARNRKPYATSATKVFDYSGDMGFLSQIELRKDLARLRKSRNNGEKAQILKRLAFCPGFSSERYSLLVSRHLQDKVLTKELMQFYLRTRKGA